MPTNDERAMTRQPLTVVVTVSPAHLELYAKLAKQAGRSIEYEVQVGVDCYADAMASQCREDDKMWDLLGVPQEDRAY